MAKKINIIANLIDSQFKKQLKDLQNGKYNVNVNVNGTGLKNANAQMRQLGSSTQNTNTVFGKLRNTISNTFSSGKLAMTSYLVVLNEINKAAREAKDTILEMDKAVTDLSVAMNGTREEASEYVKVLNKQAIDLKTTTKSVTDASDAWLRQGKSIKETETLIRDSLVLSKVGKIESADATDYLTSALNGYKLEAEDAIAVIDKLTAVDAESASEAGGLALSMSRTASAANMAGVSMDKLIGWLSVVKEVTRDSDEAVGNMAKTMLSRMNQVKAGKFIDAETGESLNDMEKVLNKVGIAMRDMNGQFISSEIVLDELGKKFNEFDSVTQRAIATQLGGTYQYEKVIALLSNYGDALKYAEISANSAGSAMQKFNESYMGSLEAAQAQLQASFDALVINTDFEEVYADILEATKGIVDFVNEVNLLKGVASGLAVTGLIKAFAAFKTGAREAYISLNQYQQALTLVNKTHISTNDFTRLLMLTKNLSASQTKLILSSKNLTLTQKKQLLINQGLSASEAKLHLQNLKLTTSYTGLKGSMVSVTNACKGLFNTIKANPLMLIMTLVSGATMAWESYKQSVEEANERAITSAETAGELVSELSELTGKYLELSKAVETDASAKEDLLSTQETLLKKLELEGETVDTLISKYGSLSEAIRQTSIDTLRDTQIDLLAGIETAKTELEEVGKAYESWHSITSRNILSSSGKDAGRAYQVLEDAGLMSSGSHSDVAGQFVLTGDDSVEGILANYKLLEDALRALRESNEFTGEELTENPVYNQIHDRMKEMEEYVEQYKTLIDDYNNSLAQDTMLSSMGSMELPDTEDGFKKFREELIATAIESQKFIGTEEEIENAINAYLSTLPNFVGYYSGAVKTEVENVAGTTEQELTKLFDKLTTSKDALSKFVSSVQSASEAYSNLMNPNVSSADILSSIQSINEAVSSMGGSLNWEFIESQENSLEVLGNAIDHISEKYAKSVLSDAGIDVNSKFGQMLANNIIQAQKASEQLSNLNTNIDSLQSAYSDLTDIVESYNKTGYLTFDQLQTLLELEPQYLQCLIDENGQLQLNEQAMVALANQRLNDAEAQAVQQAITELGQLALHDEKVAVEENAQAFTDAVDDLAGYNQELANTIAEATVGASAIRDLNAAIKGAESEGATDDQINTVLGNLKTKLQAINSVRDKLNSGGLGSVMGSKKSSSKDTTETFNWIERAVEDIESEISQLDKVVDSTFSTVEAKNKALVDQIGLINKEIELQQQAYESYIQKAESVGLSDEYKNLVQNGSINIEDITDEDLQKAIKLYQDYYDKAQDTLEKINDLHEEAKQKHVDGYELEADELKRKLDSQSITEKQYIDDMLALWEKYYDNQVEYAEVAKNKKLDILEEEKSYLQSVGSAAIALLDDQIDDLEDQKEAAIKPYKDQIEILEDKKKALEDYLDDLEDERKHEELILNLQKAQYELEKARSQRNKLVYKDGQMSYVTDDKAIRDAREKVDDAQFELTKFNIEQQIEAYDEQIEKLNELIDETEKYYDDQIKGLNKYKEEWQKAIDMEELAVNMQNFIDKFGEGSIGRLLSGDMSLITDWKQSYLDTLTEIDMTSTGTIGDIANKFKELSGLDFSPSVTGISEASDKMTELADNANNVASAISQSVSDGVISAQQELDKMNQLGKDACDGFIAGWNEESTEVEETTKQTAIDAVDAFAEGQDSNSPSKKYKSLASDAIDGLLLGVEEKKQSFVDAIKLLAEEGVLAFEEGFNFEDSELKNSFDSLKVLIESVSEAIGIGTEGTVGGLLSSLQQLSEFSLGGTEEGTGIISQFNALKEAVDSVTSSISGGTSGSSEGDASNSKSSSMSAGTTEDGESGLVSAIEKMGETATETLGEDSEGEGVIGKFAQLKSTIDTVTQAIGTGEEEEGSGEEGAINLIGALQAHYEKAEETLPEVKTLFEDLLASIEDCITKLNEMADAMASISGSDVSFSAHAEGTVGKAFANGTGNYNGLPHAEKNALRSEYGQPELTVYPDGTTELTTEPTMSDLPKDTVIFNEEQTKRIMNNEGTIIGNAHADGNAVLQKAELPSYLRPIQEGDKGYELIKAARVYQDMLKTNIMLPINSIDKNVEMMARNISAVNTNNVNKPSYVINGGINVTCPAVTSKEVANQVGAEIEKKFFGMSNYAYQKASITR